jgi:FkbM family methyltransferase
MHRLEEPELRRLSEFVPHNRPSVDVGVWWGPWTWWLAQRTPLVHAFEPHPAVADALAPVLPRNVRLYQEAASDRIGVAQLWAPRGGRGTEGLSSLLEPGEASRYQPLSVPKITLDSKKLGDVGFVKIDVEGHELSVLRGAVETLHRYRPTLLVEIEASRRGTPQDVPSYRDTFAFLTGLGYRGRFLLKGRWHPIEEFDPWTHQLRYADRISTARYMRGIATKRRYVNNFLFEALENPFPRSR